MVFISPFAIGTAVWGAARKDLPRPLRVLGSLADLLWTNVSAMCESGVKAISPSVVIQEPDKAASVATGLRGTAADSGCDFARP